MPSCFVNNQLFGRLGGILRGSWWLLDIGVPNRRHYRRLRRGNQLVHHIVVGITIVVIIGVIQPEQRRRNIIIQGITGGVPWSSEGFSSTVLGFFVILRMSCSLWQ
jgi:hypothetical protein